MDQRVQISTMPVNTCIQPKLSDLGMKNGHSSVFYRTQWTKLIGVHYLFLAYRVLIALYIVGIYVATLVDSSDGQTFLYLTTLALTVFVIYITIAAVIAGLDGIILGNRDNKAMGLRHKIHWCFFNITVNINLIVTGIYWSVLYGPSDSLLFINFHIHAVPAIITTIDLFLTAIPVRFLHFIYPLGFGTAYAVMTLIFWGAGGTTPNGPIYPFIDYSNNPGLAAGMIVGVFVAIIILHGIIWALYKLRMWLWRKCGGDIAAHDEQSIMEEVL